MQITSDMRQRLREFWCFIVRGHVWRGTNSFPKLVLYCPICHATKWPVETADTDDNA